MARTKKTELKNNGWNTGSNIDTVKINIELMLSEPMLATTPSDVEIYSTYIASKAPDASSTEEEVAAAGVDAVVEKGTTVYLKSGFVKNDAGFMRDINDTVHGIAPGSYDEKDVETRYMIWNYLIKGNFKEDCAMMSRAKSGKSATLRAFKKVIDGNVFVYPRRIAITLPDGGQTQKLNVRQRPLRASTPQGERVSIASSEEIPIGATMRFTVELLDKNLIPYLFEWLDYGTRHGLGAWRNSGAGSFMWRVLDDNGNPINRDDVK